MLYIITPCSRPENLLEISKTIPTEAQWVICYDDRVSLPPIDNAILLKCENTGPIGTLARNHMLDTLPLKDGDWILAHDDDNIIHPDLYNNIKEYLDSDYSIVYWGQLENNTNIRIHIDYLTPTIGGIDTACYMASWKYNSQVRHEIAYYHDGVYANACSKNGRILKLNQYLCYYNYLTNRKGYHEIDGWFNYSSVYDFLVGACMVGGVFVECGAWLGKSSSYLVDKALLKNIDVTIVDSWKGSANELQGTHSLATTNDIYELFLSNMGNRQYKNIKALSCEASLHFEDESCDVIFIDMEHTYSAVINDIDLWLPKVKRGGYLAGHDYSNDWIGVIQAVDEKFGKDNITIQDTCWIYKKESL